MRRHVLFAVPILVGMSLAGCTGGAASSTTRVTGPVGSPGNPQVFSCGEEAYGDTAVPQQPQPGDLAVGPLIIPNGKRLATADPAGFGGHGDYKLPFIVTMRPVTVTIDAPARGHVVIDNPYTQHGVTAATYRPCPGQRGFFAQGFAFTDGRIRGCVPLAVRVVGEPQVRRVTLSLFAGSCAS